MRSKSDNSFDRLWDALNDWQITNIPYFLSSQDEGEDAYCYIKRSEKAAAIYTHPQATMSQRLRLITHELLHILLHDMKDLALNGQPIGIMEAYERAEERAIDTLSTIITGLPWSPIDPIERTRFNMGECE